MNFIQDVQAVKFGLINTEPAATNTYCYVYENGDKQRKVVKNGESLTNKKGKQYKFTKRFKVNVETVSKEMKFDASSIHTEKKFKVDLNCTIKVVDPCSYVESEQNSIVDEIFKKIERECKRIARNYELVYYGNYEDDLNHNISNLTDFSDKGLQVGVDATVTIDESELKFLQTKRAMDDKNELELHEIKLKNKKDEVLYQDLLLLIEGTPLEPLKTTFSSYEELKKKINEMLLEDFEKHRRTKEKIMDQFMDGKIDKTAYQERLEISNVSFNSSDVVRVNDQIKVIEVSRNEEFNKITYGEGDEEENLFQQLGE